MRRFSVAEWRAELDRALAAREPELRRQATVADQIQAAIGVGMLVWTRYAAVMDATGHPQSVRDALADIDQAWHARMTGRQAAGAASAVSVDR